MVISAGVTPSESVKVRHSDLASENLTNTARRFPVEDHSLFFSIREYSSSEPNLELPEYSVLCLCIMIGAYTSSTMKAVHSGDVYISRVMMYYV